MLDWIVGLDKKAFLFLNSKHSPMWDDIMWWFSGTKFWIPLYIALIIAIIYYDLSYRVFITLLFVAITVLLCDQISVLIKNLVERPRPTHDPEIAHLVHIVNNYRGGKFAFVSSHATNVFGVATFLAHQFRSNKWGILLFSWACIVSYSRIYLGVHYPLDIIFGAILGLLIAIQLYAFKVWAMAYIDIKIKERKEKKRRAARSNNK